MLEEKRSVNHIKARVMVECRKRGMNLTDIARKTNRTPQALHDILNRANPTLKTLHEIAEAIGCQMEDLLRKVTNEEYGEVHIPFS